MYRNRASVQGNVRTFSLLGINGRNQRNERRRSRGSQRRFTGEWLTALGSRIIPLAIFCFPNWRGQL